VPAEEVRRAASDAMVALQGAFDVECSTAAERIAQAIGTEARHIRPHLRELLNRSMIAFSQVMQRMADLGVSELEP